MTDTCGLSNRRTALTDLFRHPQDGPLDALDVDARSADKVTAHQVGIGEGVEGKAEATTVEAPQQAQSTGVHGLGEDSGSNSRR